MKLGSAFWPFVCNKKSSVIATPKFWKCLPGGKEEKFVNPGILNKFIAWEGKLKGQNTVGDGYGGALLSFSSLGVLVCCFSCWRMRLFNICFNLLSNYLWKESNIKLGQVIKLHLIIEQKEINVCYK